jgi:anaerobic selenocysteine-containing dehydrogenase
MTTTLDSVCPLDCPDTCSLEVTVDAGRITKVDGSRRNPYTDGYICAKVRRFPERVYSPLRVLYPQKRVGAKGEGHFERIGWDEAIDTVATNFKRIIAAHGPAAILPHHYGGSNGLFSEEGADSRFFNRLGASELLKTICAAPTGTASRAMYGTMSGVPPEDYALAKCIVLWGVNPGATSIHLNRYVKEARRRGVFVAVIDPRRTKIAAAASLHLQPIPGTDVVLALAIAGELFRSQRVDRRFIAAHVNGAAAVEAAAAEYPLARAADVCGVAEGDILKLADAYASSSPAVIRCGWGVERNRNGGNAVRAILSLPAIAGKFGVRGGGYTMSLSRACPINATALARPDLRREPPRQINMTQLARVLTEPQTPPIAALFVYNSNPVAMNPDQNRLIRGLRREDLFTVVHDQVLTDTALFADLLLPATTFFEQRDLHRSYGHHFLQYSEAVIEPVGESINNVELFARLARAMGFHEPEVAPGEDGLMEDAFDCDRSRFSGAGPADLRSERIARIRFDGGDALIQFGTDFPTTASRKAELAPPQLGAIAYRPPPDAKYPLILLSPATEKTINSTLGEFNLLSPKLCMHPADAGARGIRSGDIVRAYNDLGEVHVPVQVADSIRAGVVSLPKGMWFDTSRNRSTVTALVPDDLTDLGDGACFNDARVEVARIGSPGRS